MRKNSVELHYKSSHKLEPCQRQLWGEQLDQGSSLLFLMCSGYRATSHHTPAIPIFIFFLFFNPAVSPPYCEESDFYPYGVNVCLSPSYIAFIDWSRSSRGGNGDWNDRLLFSCATGLNSIYWQNSTVHSCRVMKPSVIRQVQGLWPTPRQVIF